MPKQKSEEKINPPSLQSKKFDITTADFKLFIVIWNQRMGQATPDIHLKMADWLEFHWERRDKDVKHRRLLMMAFRSAGKSTITGLFAAWLLYRNADLRILVLAADFSLAKKMVRNVKRILEAHPLTTLGTDPARPEKPDQWASDRFTVRRMMELRDPSMLAKGITANITGSRADIVICDDVEVPNTCDTAEKRGELRSRLGEMEYVLVPGGLQLYVGTPHSYYTIYADEPRLEIGEDAAFLDGFSRLSLPVLDEHKQSVWPERYSDGAIRRMKKSAGPNKFASQMMLKPVNIANGRLNPKLLQRYDHDLEYQKELRTLFLGKTKLVSAIAFWDPAFGSAKGDNSVCAVIFTDDDGNFYLHHVAYIKTRAGEKADEATQQSEAIAAIAKDHFLPALAVETNGIGKFLPKILRNTLAKRNVPCRVQEVTQTRNKDTRILEAFDAVLAARRLFVHASVFHTPFMQEMQEWRPGINTGHDDGLDAVAGALALCPDRLPRVFGKGGHNWMKHGGTHKADTNFEV